MTTPGRAAAGDDGGEARPGLADVLLVRAFRLLVSLQLINAVAVWMHVVAVQWVLTARGESASVISMAPAAMAVPFLVLSLPVGAISGFASRERLMAYATGMSACAAIAAAVLSAAGHDHVWLMIATVVLVGTSLTVVGVSWQSLLPETLPRALVPTAAVLDGAVFNIARAVGPLAAGIGLGLIGSSGTFLVIAALSVVCVVTFGVRERRIPGRTRPRRRVAAEIGGVFLFVRYSPWTLRLLYQICLFGLPASALWALISIVVHDRLGLDSSGFGVMMALLGGGAVSATFVVGRFRARLGIAGFAAFGAVAYGVVLVVLSATATTWIAGAVLVVAGVAWVGVQSTWMSLGHMFLPDWIRPRVVAVILGVFQATQAVGSIFWGVAVDLLGLTAALWAAAGLLVASAISLLTIGLGRTSGIDPEPSEQGHLPSVLGELGDGPIVVRYVYTVDRERIGEFRKAMALLRRSRLRFGSRDWQLVENPQGSGMFVESYVVSGRRELIEQETERLTKPEARLRAAVEAVGTVSGPELTSAPDS